ncbi:hypothetical protein Tco_0088747 [Tanacetum coccineum]
MLLCRETDMAYGPHPIQRISDESALRRLRSFTWSLGLILLIRADLRFTHSSNPPQIGRSANLLDYVRFSCVSLWWTLAHEFG